MLVISPAFSQDSASGDKQAINDTMNKFYDSVERGDSSTLLMIYTPEMSARVKENQTKCGNMGIALFITDKVRNGDAKIKFEHREVDVLSIFDDTARVKVNYTAYIQKPEDKKPKEIKATDTAILKNIGGAWFLQNIEKFEEEIK